MLDQNFKKMKFTSDREPVLLAESNERSAGRLSSQMMDMLPDDVNLEALRAELSDLFYEKLKNNYSRLEADCDIKRNTFQKALNGKSGRNVTYQLLAKFCVGAGLSVEEAEKLFRLMGHALTDENRVDAILRYELKTHQDLLAFNEDLMENCACYKEHGIISDED